MWDVLYSSECLYCYHSVITLSCLNKPIKWTFFKGSRFVTCYTCFSYKKCSSLVRHRVSWRLTLSHKNIFQQAKYSYVVNPSMFPETLSILGSCQPLSTGPVNKGNESVSWSPLFDWKFPSDAKWCKTLKALVEIGLTVL